MFLKKLFNFNRDYRYWLDKGDGFLSEERYADARDAFGEAMEKVAACGTEDASLQEIIREKYVEAGNRLGRLNLDEAEYAVAGGNTRKAEEHLLMVLDLAEDAALRKRAGDLLAKMDSPAPPREAPGSTGHSCSGCGDHGGRESTESHENDELGKEDRFDLYIHTLPGDLPERYKGLGEKFAHGCHLNLDGHGEEALRIFTELADEKENDIVTYEMALILYRNGNLDGCEKALRRSIALNAVNPLGYLSLVQLLGETGRVSEALPLLQYMIDNEILQDQARILLGDAHLLLGDEKGAVECYSDVLSSPGHAKEAALRLIPLLEKQGRGKDAAYLAKKFNKGCC